MIWEIVLISAILIEGGTIVLRFYFNFETENILQKIMNKRDYKWIVHFHHGFLGAIIFVLMYYYGLEVWASFGLGILISDVSHHLIVLWPIVKSPEFHIICLNDGSLERELRREKILIHRFFRKILFG